MFLELSNLNCMQIVANTSKVRAFGSGMLKEQPVDYRSFIRIISPSPPNIISHYILTYHIDWFSGKKKLF